CGKTIEKHAGGVLGWQALINWIWIAKRQIQVRFGVCHVMCRSVVTAVEIVFLAFTSKTRNH
ncbi:9279_t:CDS:1, partial [Dentiscutata erythropus]